ncbi:hypothetical protein PF003_g39088 [Phytophthora fragariae]|nr:hypothetical protein PF003_g39088 [Phytophthora fragariae]
MTILLFILQRCHASFARYEAPGALPTPLAHCSRTSANPQPVCCSRDSGPVRLVLGRRCWPY